MQRHLVIRLAPLLALCVLAPGRAEAHAYHPHWSRCTEHLDWQTMTYVTARECARFTMRHTTAHPIGRRSWTQRLSPHVERRVSYPTFHRPAPTGRIVWLSVSAYSWGCGASGPMADGNMPYVGAAAGVFQPGTRMTVPGFGAVTVEDKGVPPGFLDLFVSDCPQAWAWGRRELAVTVQ